VIDLSKQYLNEEDLNILSKRFLSLLNTDVVEIRNLYEKWLRFIDTPDNPFSLASFCQILWNLNGGYRADKLINLEIIEKRPSWSKFYIVKDSTKGHIIKVHPCTEQAIEYYKNSNLL
jgi:hypothetical protein